MKNIGFSKLLDSSLEFQDILNSIKSGLLPAHINGVSEAVASHLVFCVGEKLSKGALIITPDTSTARRMAEDLSLFYDDVLFFGEKDLVFYNIDVQGNNISSERISVLKSILNNDKPIVVTSIDSALSYTVPKDDFIKLSIKFKVGEDLDTEDVCRKLNHLGYRREEIVEGKAQFSLRGGILDLFPPNSVNPYRIELFDTEIDSIREFDIVSQRSLDKINEIEIIPASEIILTDDRKDKLLKKLNEFKDTKDEALSETVNSDIDRVLNNRSFPAIDKYIPVLYSKIPTILDYIDENTLVWLYEPIRLKESAESGEWQLSETVTAFKEKGLLPNIDGNWRLDYLDLYDKLSKKDFISLAQLSNSTPLFRPKKLLTLTSKAQSPFHGKMDFFYDCVKQYKKNNYRIIIAGGTEQKAKNIANALNDEEIYAQYTEDFIELPPKGNIITVSGGLSRGFEYPLIGTAVISDREIFGNKKAKKKISKHNHKRINSYTDLETGDFVVHQNHGIGRFAGIKTMTVDNAVSDYLKIEFNGNDCLYVPANQLDLIYKYVGKEGAKVKLNSLNSNQWQLTKQKVKKSCADMADELIKLYAQRLNIKGIAFSKDSEWNRDFAATFPYEETDDQLRAIEEVSKDMERDVPMDRLLCGDVGYGKTEIALRAAFKAVMDGYQVAYLAPTTILANQVYTTFCQRMQDFPITVQMLSRFRTSGQQKEIVKSLKNGTVDIVVGTHRILSKDLEFKKLGLLIIDEEQRFGVAHKEKIKEIKTNIDVLTLTATPIPRTLHMGMVGIRDMSVLENPPKDRYPVSTYVLEYNVEIIKDAILKEVGRGGQVYYLHNQVKSIDNVAAKVRSFSPDLRVASAHGKMTETELEKIMQQVSDGEIDVLVCTTIIETGLDIPNVNTIIVEDADRMGLAQLYQLRGRVGRTNKMAYAYLTYKKDKVLTEISEKRLRAIRDFTEFGSGFKIALRDLEIRGAGNIMGAQQHGHMDLVGYDMYCKLLAEAVSELKGVGIKEEIQTLISLDVNAYIPEKYIKGENFRIEIYKKISMIENQQDAYDVYEEIEDRYGDVPKEVNNLIEISLINSMSSDLGIEEIARKKDGIIFIFSKEYKLDLEIISKLITEYKSKLLFTPVSRPYLTLRYKGRDVLTNVKNILHSFKTLKDEKK